MSQTTSDTSASEGLSVRGLAVAYGDLRAVDRVDLDVAAGEVVALLGASGSGKSSLLRAVAGLEDVAGGTVTWDGRNMVRVPVHKRGFGLMFQDGQLFEHRDVGGNIAYGLTGLPRASRAERVREMLELVGLPGFERRRVTTLSGGQAQRVALARALAPAPRLLLLDEPLSALDRALREQLATDVRAILRQGGTTALYVTHDQDEAMTVADRVGVMKAGRLLRLDTPQRLWADPGSRSVARFLGFDVLDVPGGLALAPGALRVVGAGAEASDEVGEDNTVARDEKCHSRRLFDAADDEEPHDSNDATPQVGAGAGVKVSHRDTLGDPGLGRESGSRVAIGVSGVEEAGAVDQRSSEHAQVPIYAEAPTSAPAFADLRGTVLASRLRRGQWEAEVEVAPEQLAELVGAIATSEPAESGSGADGTRSVGQPEAGADGAGEAEPARRSDAGVEAMGGTSGEGEPARAVALAQRPHTPGERVALRLDPARTARL